MFSRELAPEKARLIEFGRFAARNRERRGLGKPEAFRFLGFTHICASATNGSFLVKRITDSKRMRAKQRAGKAETRRRAHQPIPEQGHWLAGVLRGHHHYYAVSGNSQAVNGFRDQVTRRRHRALRRRSQRQRLNWERMHRLAQRWLPPATIKHPWPDARFDVRTQARSPVH
jgi:hypothetical protein